MKIRYDSKIDAMYIELAHGKYKASRKVSESVLVDEDAKGKVLGIEILDAKTTIPSFDPTKNQFTVQTA